MLAPILLLALLSLILIPCDVLCIQFSGVIESCEARTTPEIHEKCGIYTYYRVKPLLKYLEEIQTKFQNLNTDREENTNQIKFLEDSLQVEKSVTVENKQIIEQLRIEIGMKESALHNLHSNIVSLQMEVNKLTSELTGKNKAILERDNLMRNVKQDSETKLNYFQSQIFDLQSQLAAKQNLINAKENSLRESNNQLSNLQSQCANLRNNQKSQENVLTGLRNQVRAKDEEIRRIQRLRNDEINLKIIEADNITGDLLETRRKYEKCKRQRRHCEHHCYY